MILYLHIFFIALVYLFLSSKDGKSNNKILAFIFLYIAIFLGIGDMIGGYDRYIYGEVFDTIADELHGKRDLSRVLYLVEGKEYGYFFWQTLVGSFTSNRYIYILLTMLLVYLLFFKTFKEYIQDYPMATIVFLGFFYYFSMTYLRQVIACGIIWQGVRFVWERKLVKFILTVLLAYSFHNSAILFLAIYFIPIKKYSKRNIVLALLIAIIIGLSPIPNLIMYRMNDRIFAYANEEQGFRIEYLLEVLFLIFVIFKNYNHINTNPKTLTMLNITFAFCFMLLVFMRFGQGGRLGWYFLIGIIYTLTYLSNQRKIKKWVRPLVVTVSFLLFLRITIAWGDLNFPYKTFFTNGEPSGNGYVYYKYEYNYSYTSDKFCRKAWDPIFKY